jgi:hypothetical protein
MFRTAIIVLALSTGIHLPVESQHTPYIWLSDGGAIGENATIEFLTPYGSIPLPPIPARDIFQIIPLGGGKLAAIGSDHLFLFP